MKVETDNDVLIRSATPADAADIARVHIISWRGAYAHVLPADYLDSLDVAERTTRWEGILGASRDEDAEEGCLELYAIYLDPEAWGRGVARDLMRTVLADVPPQVRMTLWVLAQNDRAHHFYRRHGFQPDGVERIEDIADVPVTEIRFARAPERNVG
jgi:GNAT superfamily N-acetyltransferase